MKLAVIGVGLIGGSFALALRKAKAVSKVVGVGRSEQNLKLARERGIIDAIASDPGSAAKDADLVLVATPVAQFPAVFSSLRDSNALITDGGSTTRDVIAAARKHLGKRIAQFVPAHPIAGAEKSGAAAANADLFAGKRVVITPLEENAPETISRVELCAANKDQVLVELKKFTGKLEEVRRLLEDPPALQKLFAEARDARDRWIRSS
jgi:prephenate dehydrogenase